MININDKIKVTPNALTREQCLEIINGRSDFKYDKLKCDMIKQDIYSDKQTIDKNTIDRNMLETLPARKVAQSYLETPVFEQWDGKPVFVCKVMRYKEGEFVKPHKDAMWMCLSNYWKPNTNMSSDSLVVIPLNDDYEGGDFIVDDQRVSQEVGTAIQIKCDPFNHDASPRHSVSKVTSGVRYSLVFWNFK